MPPAADECYHTLLVSALCTNSPGGVRWWKAVIVDDLFMKRGSDTTTRLFYLLAFAELSAEYTTHYTQKHHVSSITA